ncbi:hypothetical protein GCM10022252_75910 [Streptosporangium oxazolinicum]|uniref:Uncharacterized protein n=1 Tax=Streptosporangium oxazolinicum TaxID=909287 RepID=A0ABP8BKV2_9ACTN
MAAEENVFDNDVLDLDVARARRSSTQGRPIPLRLGGKIICKLPAELPVDVLLPLTKLGIDTTGIIRMGLDAWKAGNSQRAGIAVLDLLLDLLIERPSLPRDLLAAVHEMGQTLMGTNGYAAFVAARPSVGDIVALVRGLGSRYAIRLGESTSSTADSGSGETSTPTSPTTTQDSTSTESGSAPEIADSSPPADSSTSASDSHAKLVSTPVPSSEPSPGTTSESSSPS